MASDLVIARPYAKAAFEYAFENNQVDAWGQFLQIASQITMDPTMALLLNDPQVSKDQLLAIYQASNRNNDDAIGRFIGVLIENKRLGCFAHIQELFAEFRAESEKTLVADVIAYQELSSNQESAIKQALKQRLKRDIQLNYQLDPNILGGAIIRAGDIVIDGSVRRRLEQLREQAIR